MNEDVLVPRELIRRVFEIIDRYGYTATDEEHAIVDQLRASAGDNGDIP